MNLTRRCSLVAAAMTLAGASSPAQGPAWAASIQQALGRAGSWNADSVYKVTFPRTDLHVTVGGVAIASSLALTSWAAFKPAHGGVMAMGDLVVTEMSVNQVVAKLRDGGANPTAVHNHLVGETPHIMYVHFMATGDAAKLARAVHDALVEAGLPAPVAPSTVGIPLDTAAISRAFGRPIKAAGAVLQLSVARAETIHMGDDVIPPAMGLATSINMQPTTNGRAAITGDFVLIEKEIAPVMQTLQLAGIQVTALHSHTTGEEPRLYFMHFWANADPLALARGIHDALGHMNVK